MWRLIEIASFLIIGCPRTWIESSVYGVNFLCYAI
ncbi:hypothetical protein SLEP1_g11539 [Rubroshorea leprosula]|nr:hypothetical protein SLEP1_g11539 [Rubroshorea leprosula]